MTSFILHTCSKIIVLLLCLLRDFLPRGSGIVTRRPLILQLVNNKAGVCLHPSIVFVDVAPLSRCLKLSSLSAGIIS